MLPGDYLSVAAVLGLFGLAVSGTIAGLAAVLDRAGLALGALVVFLVGNALSGVSSAAELLPQPWGAVRQALPIGAGSTMLRSVAYFDGHGAGSALAVLCAYAIGGLVLVAAGRRGLTRPAAEVAAEARVRNGHPRWWAGLRQGLPCPAHTRGVLFRGGSRCSWSWPARRCHPFCG